MLHWRLCSETQWRGLGQSLVEKFLTEGWRVFAGERQLDQAATRVVDASGALTRVGLDVLDVASVARAARHVAERATGLDVLINNVSSEAGSIERSCRDRTYGYCMSKPMNMQTTMLDRGLKSKGFNVISIHPGWMRTDMGSKNAALDPRESACIESSTRQGRARLVSCSTTASRIPDKREPHFSRAFAVEGSTM